MPIFSAKNKKQKQKQKQKTKSKKQKTKEKEKEKEKEKINKKLFITRKCRGRKRYTFGCISTSSLPLSLL